MCLHNDSVFSHSHIDSFYRKVTATAEDLTYIGWYLVKISARELLILTDMFLTLHQFLQTGDNFFPPNSPLRAICYDFNF